MSNLYNELLKDPRFRSDDGTGQDENKLNRFLESVNHEVFIHKEDRKLVTAIRNANSKPPKSNGLDTKIENYNKFVTVFHFLYGFPLEYFTFDKSSRFGKLITSKQKSSGKLFKIGYSPKSRGLKKKTKRQIKLEKKYLNGSKEFLDHLKHNLYVYDYLDRFVDDGDELSIKTSYIKMHDEIFNEIEGMLFTDKNKPQFYYARYLALPIGLFSRVPGGEMPDKKVIAREVVDRCSLPLFKHICRCLRQYSAYNKNDVSKIQTNKTQDTLYGGFYVLHAPTRKYHYAVMNSGSYMMSEYYRYNKWGQSKVDLLFLEDDRQKEGKLGKLYMQEMTILQGKIRPKLNLELIGDIIKDFFIELVDWSNENQGQFNSLKDIEANNPSMFSKLKKVTFYLNQ